MDIIRIAKLHSDAILPCRKNPTDAGMDLYNLIETNINFGEPAILKTGVTIEIPKGYFGWITNKSKNDFLVGGGIIDEGYQGELLVKIINISHHYIKILSGQAIAQLLIIPVKIPEIVEVNLDEIHKIKTARGSTGGIVNQVFTDGTIDQVMNDAIMYANNEIVGYMADGTPLWGWRISNADRKGKENE